MAGERGPLPNPVARRRNKRPETGREILVGRPTLPRTLTGEAAAEWRRVVPQLEQAGLIAKVDRAVLIRYCTLWADYVEIDANLQTTGKLIKGRRDGVVRNPLWIMRNDALDRLSEMGRQLGLSPVARIRIGVEHKSPEAAAGIGERPVSIDERRRRLQG